MTCRYLGSRTVQAVPKFNKYCWLDNRETFSELMTEDAKSQKCCKIYQNSNFFTPRAFLRRKYRPQMTKKLRPSYHELSFVQTDEYDYLIICIKLLA